MAIITQAREVLFLLQNSVPQGTAMLVLSLSEKNRKKMAYDSLYTSALPANLADNVTECQTQHSRAHSCVFITLILDQLYTG